jgi:3'(2'), 5'-bisphosphate nucleotidase
VPVLDVAASAELADALTAIGAGAAIAIRRSAAAAAAGESNVRIKADGSPVTTADQAAEAVICEGLARLAPDVPIVSEEQAECAIPSVAGVSYFLVDPLDGTREFIAGRDEYTVNIAIVTNGAPILGIIVAPALGLIWRGIPGRGAERIALESSGKTASPEIIRARPRPAGGLTVMVSRSHLDPRTQAYVAGLVRARTVPCGSALKFCRLAEGAADLYPRLAPTRDWDIAAGHAIVKAAGGEVAAPDGGRLRYGTAALLIPGFIASGDPRSVTLRD